MLGAAMPQETVFSWMWKTTTSERVKVTRQLHGDTNYTHPHLIPRNFISIHTCPWRGSSPSSPILEKSSFHHHWYGCQSSFNAYVSLNVGCSNASRDSLQLNVENHKWKGDYQSWCLTFYCHRLGFDRSCWQILLCCCSTAIAALQ